MTEINPFIPYAVQPGERLDPADYIPWGYHAHFCVCLDPSSDPHARKCRKCGKWERWQLMRSCYKCHQPYFFWFRHPERKSIRQSLCYHCLVETTGVEGTPPPDITPRELRSLDDIMADNDEEVEDFVL
jgi:hypothetical protein